MLNRRSKKKRASKMNESLRRQIRKAARMTTTMVSAMPTLPTWDELREEFLEWRGFEPISVDELKVAWG